MLNSKERIQTSVIFTFVTLLMIVDIYEDMLEGSSLSHVLKESIIMVLGILGLVLLWMKYFSSKKENQLITKDNIKLKRDLSEYKKKTQHLNEGLGDKIIEQLNSWKLTKSEKDIALLLLKGLSIKEIAEIRNSAEKTIKQHTSNIYSKSNLSGRTELSAFFLEDLLILK